MIIVKKLDNPKSIEDAGALLYKEYIKKGHWLFSDDNPSELKVIVKNNRELLIDRITPHAIWFGAFYDNRMVGCIRLFKGTKNIPFEIERYPTAKKIFKQYIEIDKFNIYEASRACVDSDFGDNGIFIALYLKAAELCQKEKASIFGSTANEYLKSILRRIEWPCKEEDAFKFEETNLTPVNFYLASYKNAEVSHIIQKIKSLQDTTISRSVNILDALSIVAPIFPAPIYWHDIQGVVLGINSQCLKAIGKSLNEVLGKTPYDFYPKVVADHIWHHSAQVIKSGETLSQEEYVYDASGKCIGTYLAIKAPLYHECGSCFGIIGTSIDITAEKEAERLKLENEATKMKLETQEKFTKNANQVAHDIRSPLASLLMIVKACKEIPEQERVALREAAHSIGDIANHLLSRYKSKESEKPTQLENREPLLLSALLLQLLTDKKYQYQNCSIKFSHEFSHEGEFAFITIQASSFKRMISNLINNAVDAFEGKAGQVTLKLDSNLQTVKIVVIDNGKGMPSEIKEKILQNIAVTADKAEGHGIGLTQVRETLIRNQGEMSIESEINQGTQITLEFPRVKALPWFAEEIKLAKDDIVIILDDEPSIHAAWDARFELLLSQSTLLCVHHFTSGKAALHFIQGLSPLAQKKLFLLTDFELLKQEFDGLHVVEKSKITRAILVTSHHTNAIVLERAKKLNTKILPKQLASEIPIIIESSQPPKKNEVTESKLKKVDVILVEDDETLAKNFINYIFMGDVVDYFTSPEEFKKHLHEYPKDTRIYLDNNFPSGVKGMVLADELHVMGYTRLYLLSGEEFDLKKIPEYLKVIRKDDIGNLKDW